MLVKHTNVDLTGYLSAHEGGAGFVIPVFSGRDSNLMLVQEIARDGKVGGFRELEPKGYHRLDHDERRLSVGEPALWGFRDSNGKTVIDQREGLRMFLASHLDTLEPPFLKLQAAQFCEDLDEMVGAWRTAFAHMDERSPRSARAWRDVVVIPTQMRLAVEQAILEHGFAVPVDRLARTVEVSVKDTALQLYLSAELHTAFVDNAGARESLERNAAPIRHAFRLSHHKIALLTKDATPAANLEPELPDDVAVAGFGDMALSLLGQVAPRIRRSSQGYSHVYPAPRGIKEMVLLQRDELSRKLDWGSDGPPRRLDPHNRVLLVTFQLAAAQSHLVDAAIAFANENRVEKRIIVAVIPHLPEEPEYRGEVSKSLLPLLHRHFDAVWALSDRSPYTRQALAFGPARSVSASAAHFSYLLRLAEREELRHELLPDRQDPPSLSVIASAIGDRKVPTLAEHAMMRLAHHLFDLKTVTSAVVSGGLQADEAESVCDVIRRDCPGAEVHTRRVGRDGGGPSRISVALKNVRTVPGGGPEFERYCADQLMRFGWQIDQFEPNGELILAHRGIENVPAACKLVAARMLDNGLRSRPRRQFVQDGILLTSASIRRRSFAINVLNGTVPVHYSRIEALFRIYRRRHVYALSYLQQDKTGAERMLTPAALDWLALHHWVASKNIGKPKIASDAFAEVDVTTRMIFLKLPLQFTRGRGRHMKTVEGEASIIFDEDGWHLDALSADGAALKS